MSLKILGGQQSVEKVVPHQLVFSTRGMGGYMVSHIEATEKKKPAEAGTMKFTGRF